MSVTAFPLERRIGPDWYQEAVERKRRLWNPPGGRVSSDLEVLSDTEARRRKVEADREAARIRREEYQRQLMVAHEAAIRQIVINSYAQAATEHEPPLIDEETVWPVTIRDIARSASRHFEISMLDLLSHRRTARVVRPRQIVMYLAREMTTNSFPEIGRRLKGRDHTTVLHAWQKITRLLPIDEKLAAEVEAVRAGALAGRVPTAKPITG